MLNKTTIPATFPNEVEKDHLQYTNHNNITLSKGLFASWTIKLSHVMPRSHQLSVNFRMWNSWGCHHGWMPSCSHQHLNLLNIFVLMYNCSHGCPTSLGAKNNYRLQSWALWTNHNFFVVGLTRLTCVQAWTSKCRLWPSLAPSCSLNSDGPSWKSLWETNSPTENAL